MKMPLLNTISPVPLAWRQLADQRVRFVAAVVGVTFAVVLVLTQLGFRNALYASAVRLHEQLAAELVLVSPQYAYFGLSKPFSQRRLHQARSHAEVVDSAAVEFDFATFKNLTTGGTRSIILLAIDPDTDMVRLAGVNEQRQRIRLADTLLFDAKSRPEYGIRPAQLDSGERFAVELAQRRVFIHGGFRLGTGFAVDGTVLASRQTFHRLLPHRHPATIDIGLLRLRPGADPALVRSELRARLPADVEVLTQAGFIAREQAHWAETTPIGYVFTLGAIIGLGVGAVIVYLVLLVNVAEHLPEYATLKAVGFTDGALFGVVLQQAIILAVLGFAFGSVLGSVVYRVAAEGTQLPMRLDAATTTFVFLSTLLTCGLSGAAALRKVRAADPAEVFA